MADALLIELTVAFAATTARHPKVSESQNGARSSFGSFDRLDKRFADVAA